MNARAPRTAADFDALRARDPECRPLQAHIDRDELVEMTRLLYPPPPCPRWCQVGPGHEYEGAMGATVVEGVDGEVHLTDEPLVLYREHLSVPVSRSARAGAYVSQSEWNDAGTVRVDPPQVYLDAIEHEGKETDVAGARARAAELRERAGRMDLAADMLDAITDGPR